MGMVDGCVGGTNGVDSSRENLTFKLGKSPQRRDKIIKTDIRKTGSFVSDTRLPQIHHRNAAKHQQTQERPSIDDYFAQQVSADHHEKPHLQLLTQRGKVNLNKKLATKKGQRKAVSIPRPL